MSDKAWRTSYLRLNPQVAIKNLERSYLYHIKRDELYEIDEKAMTFLEQCDGSSLGADLTSEDAFVKYCLDEDLLEAIPSKDSVEVPIAHSLNPSLRYLELQLLHRCNLKCRHCYLGHRRQDELSLKDALKITGEFASFAGLRLLISGGEPLLYPYLKNFIRETAGLKLHRVLLTNGTMITDKNVSWLNVEEIQFSLDGWREGHDRLRGNGTFDLTIKGILTAKQAGIPISIATMIHQGNLGEFEQLRRFTEEISAIKWEIDAPCITGSLRENQDLFVPYERAAPFMKYAYGGGYHGSSDGFACGRHLMTILPTGKAVKCGFYEDTPLGDARKSLQKCWLNLKHIPLEKLECRGCPVIADCAGGCRFRAPHPLARDPLMCAFYEI